MIRLGTVGTSKICERFLTSAKLSERFSLSAVYSRKAETAETFAKEHDCNVTFCNLSEMAKSGLIDAVYIASPNAFHASQSRIFLENGIHVLCEKPITVSKTEYEDLKKLAESKHLVYMEAVIPLHTPQRESIKKAIADISPILGVRIDYSQRSSRLDRFLRGENVNIFDMSLHAGALMDIGVYCVNAAVDFFGAPQSIKAESSILPNGADGSGSVIFKYPGFTAVLTYSKVCDGLLGSEIIGAKGTVTIGRISRYEDVCVYKDGQKTVIAENYDTTIMKGEAERFADLIEYPKEKRNIKICSEINDCCIKSRVCIDEIKQLSGLIYKKID